MPPLYSLVIFYTVDCKYALLAGKSYNNSKVICQQHCQTKPGHVRAKQHFKFLQNSLILTQITAIFFLFDRFSTISLIEKCVVISVHKFQHPNGLELFNPTIQN